ncbi:MAG TPA: 6-carboxytetrahydropterin synthase QueD [Treponemataceae bacterium]|nr:6-carboxytetrahydropterin synthase QueD [Treponemataceae bacterium]
MYQIRVEADFAAAHYLQDYHGKCENLHGHNYNVYAHVQGEKLDEGGMLFDFSQLKAALRIVCKKLDHTNLNDIALFENNPSAERIAKYIYEEVQKELSYTKNTSAQLYCIDVFETPTSRARYIPRFPVK